MVTLDNITYTAFQKLNEFVLFVGNLKYVREDEREHIPGVIELIKNLDKPGYGCADISIDIFDYELQMGQAKRNGVYWRTWGLYIQETCIEVVAESSTNGIHPDDIDLSHFYMDLYLSLEEKYYKPLTDIHYFDPFIEDVKSYKKYITENLNKLEVSISIQPVSIKNK